MTRTEAIQKIQATPCLRARIAAAAERWRSVDPARVACDLFYDWLRPGDPDILRPIDVIAIKAITRRALAAAVAAGEMPGSYLIAAPYLGPSAMPTAKEVRDAGVGIWHDTERSGYFLSAIADGIADKYAIDLARRS